MKVDGKEMIFESQNILVMDPQILLRFLSLVLSYLVRNISKTYLRGISRKHYSRNPASWGYQELWHGCIFQSGQNTQQ